MSVLLAKCTISWNGAPLDYLCYWSKLAIAVVVGHSKCYRGNEEYSWYYALQLRTQFYTHKKDYLLFLKKVGYLMNVLLDSIHSWTLLMCQIHTYN